MNSSLEWKTEKRKISDLVPYVKNPRILTKEQEEDLKKSIKKFNLAEIPAVNTDGTIIAGHQRLKIMQLLGRGEESIDVRVPNRALTEEELAEYCIRSNKNTGEWDYEALSSNFDKDMLLDAGFTEEELDKIFKFEEPDFPGDPDYLPKLPEEAETVHGDLYILGRHRLLCGDPCIITDLKKLTDNKTADLVFSVPPGSTTEGGYDKFIYDVFLNMFLVMEEGASFYITGNRESTLLMNKIMEEISFYISQWIISRGIGKSDPDIFYQPRHEIITFGWKKGKPHRWFGDRTQTDVQDFRSSTETNETEEASVEMIRYFINNSSLQSETVLDLFGNKGATLIACERTNRNCLVMESDPLKCDMIVKRWEQFTGNKAERV